MFALLVLGQTTTQIAPAALQWWWDRMFVQGAPAVVAICAMLFTAINCGLAIWNFILNHFVWLSADLHEASGVVDAHDVHRMPSGSGPNAAVVEHRYDVVVINRGAPAWMVNVRLVGKTESGQNVNALFQLRDILKWPIPLLANQPMTFAYTRCRHKDPARKPEPIYGHILVCNGDKVMKRIKIPTHWR